MPSFGIKELLHGKMPTPFIHMKLTRALLCLGKMSSFCFVFFQKYMFFPPVLLLLLESWFIGVIEKKLQLSVLFGILIALTFALIPLSFSGFVST